MSDDFTIFEIDQKTVKDADLLFRKNIEFIAGTQSIAMIPPESIPEFAFIGRSNVGKSSLINALCNRKSLARVSHTPGRTQQINFFSLNNALCLVDLPGYGFAKVSKKMREEWSHLIPHYLSTRASLKLVFVLVDMRHGLKESDHEMLSLLDRQGIQTQIILTKQDKVKQADRPTIIESVKEGLFKHPVSFPHPIGISAHKKTGFDVLRALILKRMV